MFSHFWISGILRFSIIKRNVYLHFALLSSTQQLYWMLCFWSKWAILWNWLEQLVKSNGNHWKAGKYLTKGINLSVIIHFVLRTWTVSKISSDLILCSLFFKLIFWMGCIVIFCWVQFECKACFYIKLCVLFQSVQSC